MGLWVIWQTREPLEPADIALQGIADPGRPLRITLFGTSLTANYDWPERLAARLATCLRSPSLISRVTRPGAGSEWGLTQVAEVAATTPDILLMEFAINDADLRDGQSLASSTVTHRSLVAALQATLPDTRIVLMTMSPAQGPRGWIRPWLGAHYAMYRDLTAERGVGLIDLYPRWLALPRDERGLRADGLHPDRDVAARMIVPVLAGYLADAVGHHCL